MVTLGGANAFTFSLLSDVQERLGSVRDALESARLASRYDRRNPRHQRRLGDMSRRARQLRQASTAYRQVLELQPGNQEVRLALAAVLLDLGAPDPARRLLAKVRASTLRNRDDGRLLNARLALAVGQPDEARRLAADAVRTTQDPHALRSAGELQLTLAAAGAEDWASATRRIARYAAGLRQAGWATAAEELTRQAEQQQTGQPYVEQPRPAPEQAAPEHWTGRRPAP